MGKYGNIDGIVTLTNDRIAKFNINKENERGKLTQKSDEIMHRKSSELCGSRNKD